MNAQTLADIERELSEITDNIDWRDENYEWNSQIDALRALGRKIGAEVELIRLGQRTAA